jgi:hypothetical protein
MFDSSWYCIHMRGFEMDQVGLSIAAELSHDVLALFRMRALFSVDIQVLSILADEDERRHALADLNANDADGVFDVNRCSVARGTAIGKRRI